MSFGVLLGLFLVPTPGYGELRAFLLRIEQPGKKKVRYVTTSLDPLQYEGFGLLREGEVVSLEDSWLCRGRTGGFRQLCPRPRPSTIDATGLESKDAGDSAPSGVSTGPTRTDAGTSSR